jgi:hypothetical protein
MAGGSVLAEQVLHSVLDAQPVDISDIRAALVALQAKPQPEPRQSTGRAVALEKVVAQAAVVVEAHSANDAAFAAEEDPDYDREWGAIEALGRLLNELPDA